MPGNKHMNKEAKKAMRKATLRFIFILVFIFLLGATIMYFFYRSDQPAANQLILKKKYQRQEAAKAIGGCYMDTIWVNGKIKQVIYDFQINFWGDTLYYAIQGGVNQLPPPGF